MISRIAAIPGQWYLDRESRNLFQVVSIDADDRLIETQYADGSLEETSMEDWAARSLENCEQPEDWMGPFDDLGPEDIGLPEVNVEARGSGMAMDRALLDIEERRSPPTNSSEE
jgi:hypothetical protein